MKISQRLQQIDRMIYGHYDHIWDCCCDHGLLGMLLLQRNAAKKVHFVDCVMPLMQQLSIELQRFFPKHGENVPPTLSATLCQNQNQWQVHCIDVAALPLGSCDIRANHLIIIAGVGGELLVELVRSILARHSHCRLEFILCPVHHNYYVRSSLAELGLLLKNELLLEENRRFYEILHLRHANGALSTNAISKNAISSNEDDMPLSCTGSIMWQGLNEDKKQQAKRYLKQTIGHYQRIPESRLPNKLLILAAYQGILLQLNDGG